LALPRTVLKKLTADNVGAFLKRVPKTSLSKVDVFHVLWNFKTLIKI